MTTYMHGAYISETPTSAASPVTVNSGLPVVVGVAPIHLAASTEYVNKPLLARNYQEAATKLGYSSDWEKYTLCEAVKAFFMTFGIGPIVFVNVLDPDKHKQTKTDQTVNITNGTAKIEQDGVLLDTLVVKLTSAGQPLIKNTDYVAAFDTAGVVVITPISGGAIDEPQTTLTVTYNHLDPDMVTNLDIIGGVDGTTGAFSGLELVNRVYPLFRMVPGQILAPGWSHDATVATVMKAKAGNINGLFKAMAITDVDTADAALYNEVPGWKTTNKYSDPLQVVCWPKVKVDGEVYHLSTHFAGVACRTDNENDDLPFVSPSNRPLLAAGAVVSDGTEVSLGPEQANFLNGGGVVTALNSIGGWRLWGNRTAAYPQSEDVKDTYIPVRRMFNFVANTIIINYSQYVDDPANRRMIDTVVDSLNLWLNGLTARGALLGGRVEFRREDNSSEDLINGNLTFRIFVTPPTPAEDIEFVLEFDANYLNAIAA